VEEKKKQYYNAMGWDERGIPTEKELRRLGLGGVNEKIRKLRK
jgi:aldehyde:ferredoxin oxidoreductase